MIRLDALNRLRDVGKKDVAKKVAPIAPIEINPVDHEEPTWDVRYPGEARRKRLDGRTRAILAAAAAAALVVNAGAAWTYWQITGSRTTPGSAPTVVELAMRARSDLNRPLTPGQTGNMTVTVTNELDFPLRITSVTPGIGNVVADDEHRDDGCKEARVAMTHSRFAVTWEVPRNTIGAFTIPDALVMRPEADAACGGAIFTVPVQVSGVSRPAS